MWRISVACDVEVTELGVMCRIVQNLGGRTEESYEVTQEG